MPPKRSSSSSSGGGGGGGSSSSSSSSAAASSAAPQGRGRMAVLEYPEDDDVLSSSEPSPLLGPDASAQKHALVAPELRSGEEKRSPHGICMKALFGWAGVSPLCAIIAVGACREVYSLKYRVDVGVLGTLHIGHGVLEIVFSLMIGHLQDKELLVFRCFSKERWGRRAPWLLCHCPIMAVSMYFCWAPPSMAPSFLAGWYFFIVALGMWSWEQILIAYQAGAVECYPFKEERVVVEAFNVGAGALGVSLAVGLIAVSYSYDLAVLPEMRSTLGLACGATGLLSLVSAWAVKDARQPTQASAVPPFLVSFREVMQNGAFRWLAAANILEGIASGTLVPTPANDGSGSFDNSGRTGRRKMTRIDPTLIVRNCCWLHGAGVILPVLLHLRRGAVGLGDLNLDCGNSCGRTVDPITVCGVLGALLRVKEPDATRLDDRRAAA